MHCGGSSELKEFEGFIEGFGRTCVSRSFDIGNAGIKLCAYPSVKVAPSIATSFFTYEMVRCILPSKTKVLMMINR